MEVLGRAVNKRVRGQEDRMKRAQYTIFWTMIVSAFTLSWAAMFYWLWLIWRALG
jgi:hypothetical protein